MTKRSVKLGLVAAGMVTAIGGTAGYAAAGSDDDASDTAITGSALEKASAAALSYTGEGNVTGTEVDDEESYYEVEVTLADGSEVDVQLDETFAVVSSDADQELEE